MTAPWFTDSTEDRLAPSSLPWGFSSGSWSLFPLSKDKRATISMRSQIKTASFNISIKLKQRLVKNFNIWTKDLKKENRQEKAHEQRRMFPNRGYRVYFNETSMIFRKFNRKLYSNWFNWAMFEKSWNWELMNRKIKSTQNFGTYEIIFLVTGK